MEKVTIIYLKWSAGSKSSQNQTPIMGGLIIIMGMRESHNDDAFRRGPVILVLSKETSSLH